ADRRQVRDLRHRPSRPRAGRAAAGDRPGAAQAGGRGSDGAGSRARAQHVRSAVPVPHGAGGGKGGSAELLRLLRGHAGLLSKRPGPLRPGAGGGGAARRADVPHRCAPRGTERGAAGEAGAGGEAMSPLCCAAAIVLTVLPVGLRAQVDRSKPPTLPPPPALKLPAIQTATLPNGLTLAVVEMHKVPVVDVQVLLDAGAARDPADLPGLATFTALMLQQGAGTRGALDVADEAAFLGAQLNTTATADGAVASLHAPRRRLEAALDLLADVVLRPTFPDSEVARQRELRGAQLVQQRDEPVAVANVAFPAIVYGPAHPYGHPLNGTDAATAALTRDRVAGFYRASYRPNAARVLMVGDITLAQARGLVATRFGAWERGDVPEVAGGSAAAPAARAVYLIDKPGAAQSVIRIGHLGPARSTPDWYALEVLNTILGGAFTSRLNQNL